MYLKDKKLLSTGKLPKMSRAELAQPKGQNSEPSTWVAGARLHKTSLVAPKNCIREKLPSESGDMNPGTQGKPNSILTGASYAYPPLTF